MDYFNLALLPALLIFIAVFVVSLKNLKWGFWAVLITTPLVHKELFSLGGIWDLLPIRVALLGLFLASIIHFLKWSKSNTLESVKQGILRYVNTDLFLILLLLLWIIRAISLFTAKLPQPGLLLFAFYTSVTCLYFVFKYLTKKFGTKFINKTIYIYIALGILTSLFAVYQYYERLCCRYTIGGIWVVPGFTPRLGSTFWDVNHFGGFLITIIPIFFALFFAIKSKFAKILMILSAVFLTWALFMTQSRSSWIGLVLGMFITLIIYYLNKLRAPLAVLTIGFIIGIAGLLSFTTYNHISIRDKIASYMHYRLDSTDTHMILLEGAGEIFVNNIVIGTGYGNFNEAFRETETADTYFSREPKLRESKVPPHSVWGEVLAETGGLGIVTYSFFMILAVGFLIVSIFESKDRFSKYLGIGILGSIISILITALFYSYNIEFYWILLFIGIGFSMLNLKENWNLLFVMKWWYSKKITSYLIIIPPALFYIFLKLGTNSLIDWDEAIYAKVAKNIVMTGNWLTLHWDDMNSTWFEKPPLYMWLTALAFKVTGFNAFGARIVSAIFGLIGIVVTYKFGSKLYNKLTGVFAALILLSTVHYLYYSRNGMLDVTVTFFILSSIYTFYLATKSKILSQQSLFFILCGVLIGLGVMTKAIVGLLPFAIIAIYLILERAYFRRPIPYKGLSKMLISALVVVAPWHLYSTIVYGYEFWKDYFRDQILNRGLSGMGHTEPWYYFFIVVKTSFRIWIFPLIAALITIPWFIDKKKKSEYLLIIVSALFMFSFFSYSKDKLLWYIIPIYPFLAIISARFMERALVIFNSILKKEIRFDFDLIRSLGILAVFLASVFYIVIVRNRIYYPDTNKDKVALVRINNLVYPIAKNPDKKLYSVTVPPTLIFYSDHRIKNIDRDGILDKIENAEPAEENNFLVNSELYYDLGKSQDEISAPLVLDVKGAAGGWILIQSKSRVRLLNEQLNVLKLEKDDLSSKLFFKTITPLERIRLDEVNRQYDEIVTNLTDYGHPPF